MNITQILQIADWAIKNTGNSFLQSLGVIPGQYKFVNLGTAIAHFDKNTDEVISITVKDGNHYTVYANDFCQAEVLKIYDMINEATMGNSTLDIIDSDSMIALLNKMYNREPDSYIGIDIKPEELAILDNLADEAGLTRNGYLIKAISAQIPRLS